MRLEAHELLIPGKSKYSDTRGGCPNQLKALNNHSWQRVFWQVQSRFRRWPHSSGDFKPELTPVRTGFECEESFVALRRLAASASTRTTAAATTRLIDSATSPTAPVTVGPRIGARTASPKTGYRASCGTLGTVIAPLLEPASWVDSTSARQALVFTQTK